MPDQRRYHHGDLRAALMDAADTLLRERGVSGWSLREASSAVGVSPSAAYHHFPSRDELVRALAGRALGALADALRHSLAQARGAAPEARILALGRGYVRWAIAEPAHFWLAFGPDRAYPGVAVNRAPYDLLSAELDRLVAAGVLTPAARAGAEEPLWSAVHGLAALTSAGVVQPGAARALDALADRVTRTAIGGLTALGSLSPARVSP